MSLRRRLIIGMILLLVVAIVTADVVTSSYLRSFLTGRLDYQMEQAQRQAYSYIYEMRQRAVTSHDQLAVSDPQAWLSQLSTTPNPSCVPTGSSTARAGTSGTTATPRLNANALAARNDPDVYLQVITDSGKVVFTDPSGSCVRPDPAPVLPTRLPVQAAPVSHAFGRNHGVFVPDRPSFDAAAVGKTGTQYRVQAVAVPGGTLVTAISLNPTNQTLSSLTRVEVIVSIAVVLGVLILALLIVRFGLSPLYDMTKTARAVAEGDFTRRIDRTEDRSEVGRLGNALNGMFGQIEAALDERAASEARLRRFVADASHELRTPLTSIRGYAELLRKGALADAETQRRASERIESEAARMSLLVDDLLLLARLDQGRPFERSPVDVAAIATDAVDAARTVALERSVSLSAPVPVWVEGDAARLRQVVDNLLRNAHVHTGPAVPVHVEVRRRGDIAVLSVSDEGPGIAQDEQGRVFDRFYRGNAARTGGGSGLGLSIVAAIAQAHGGRARVESVVGTGSTFMVEIPALTPDAESGRGGETEAVAGSPTAAGRTTSAAETNGGSHEQADAVQREGEHEHQHDGETSPSIARPRARR